jgi:hypothetical protein
MNLRLGDRLIGSIVVAIALTILLYLVGFFISFVFLVLSLPLVLVMHTFNIGDSRSLIDLGTNIHLLAPAIGISIGSWGGLLLGFFLGWKGFKSIFGK